MAYGKKRMKKPSNKKKTTSNKKNSKLKKPSPKLLGTGMARQAAEAAIKRQRELEKLMK